MLEMGLTLDLNRKPLMKPGILTILEKPTTQEMQIRNSLIKKDIGLEGKCM